MESCAGTQFLATKTQMLGHEVRLAPAQFAAPFRKSNKNDFSDAEAIAEAAVRGHMRFSRVKTARTRRPHSQLYSDAGCAAGMPTVRIAAVPCVPCWIA